MGAFCCFFLQQGALFWSMCKFLRDQPSFYRDESNQESSGFQGAMLLIGLLLLLLGAAVSDRPANGAQATTTAVKTKGGPQARQSTKNPVANGSGAKAGAAKTGDVV